MSAEHPAPRTGVRRLVPAPGPVRRLSQLTFVSTFGVGAYYVLAALYFTRILGFSVVSVGTALSIAGIAGLVAGWPAGLLADRIGARPVFSGSLLATGISIALLISVQEYWELVVVAFFFSFFSHAAETARSVVVAEISRGSDRTRIRSYLRAVTNVGATLGAGVAAIALHVDTGLAYRTVMYLDAAGYLICGILALSLPSIRPERDEEESPRGMFSVLGDAPYVAVTLVASLLALHYWIIDVAVPLWVVEHTDAPRYLVAVIFVINTAGVVVGQVPIAKRIEGLGPAVRASRLAGLLLLLTCLTFAVSQGTSGAVTVVVLLLAGVFEVLAEITQSTSAFTFSFDLAVESRMGAYQGLTSVGFALAGVIGPALMTLLPLSHGAWGWAVLGGALLVIGLLSGPAVRWAERTRAAPVAS